jgi:choline dehydrogenase
VTYIDPKGRRVSTETAYLTPDVLARPNLTVAIHAHVTRILFDQHNGGPTANGVEFTNCDQGLRFRARAKKEVVLAYVPDFKETVNAK